MRSTAGQNLQRLLGWLCAAAGFLAWLSLAWNAMSDMESATPESDEGGRLMVWALAGTLLMIAGVVILHADPDASERAEQKKS